MHGRIRRHNGYVGTARLGATQPPAAHGTRRVRQIQTGMEPPGQAAEPVSQAVFEALLAEAVSDFEGDSDFDGDPEGSERADAQALDERLPPEDLTPLSVEDEIGGRSLAGDRRGGVPADGDRAGARVVRG